MQDKIRVGNSFRARVPQSFEDVKVHICHILPSFYKDKTLVIYRIYNKHKKWWHECMCTKNEMEHYIKWMGEE